MSCPSWSRLVAHRYDGPDRPEPDGWREALEHLETCPDCREAAFAADPTLVLLRQSAEPFGEDEVARMRSGVDALCRARRVGERSPVHRAAPGAVLPGWSRWTVLAPGVARLAAAAGLAAVLLSVHPDVGPAGVDLAAGGTGAVEIQAQVPWPAPERWGGDLAATDDFFRSTATVYHFDDDDLDLVMLVDSELDV